MEMWRTSEDEIVQREDKKGPKLSLRGQIEDYAVSPVTSQEVRISGDFGVE